MNPTSEDHEFTSSTPPLTISPEDAGVEVSYNYLHFLHTSCSHLHPACSGRTPTVSRGCISMRSSILAPLPPSPLPRDRPTRTRTGATSPPSLSTRSPRPRVRRWTCCRADSQRRISLTAISLPRRQVMPVSLIAPILYQHLFPAIVWLHNSLQFK